MEKDYLQATNFQVFAVHDDVIEAEENREPVLDHGVVSLRVMLFLEAALR